MENKNIWLVPTKEESILHLEFGHNWKKNWVIFENPTKTTNIITSVPHNIYVTSNEEPKLDEWGINIKNLALFKGGGFTSDKYSKDCFRKIILTTDNLLVKDGVQAIDYEFLEWFCKNSSREDVEVETKEKYDEEIVLVTLAGKIGATSIRKNIKKDYKIIIPKQDFKHIVKSIPTEEILSNRCNAYEFIDFKKQQTFEEARQEAWDLYEHVEGNLYSTSFKSGFDLGVKWEREQEKKYSEQDMINASKYGYDFHKTTSFPEQDFEDSCIRNTQQWLTTLK